MFYQTPKNFALILPEIGVVTIPEWEDYADQLLKDLNKFDLSKSGDVDTIYDRYCQFCRCLRRDIEIFNNYWTYKTGRTLPDDIMQMAINNNSSILSLGFWAKKMITTKLIIDIFDEYFKKNGLDNLIEQINLPNELRSEYLNVIKNKPGNEITTESINSGEPPQATAKAVAEQEQKTSKTGLSYKKPIELRTPILKEIDQKALINICDGNKTDNNTKLVISGMLIEALKDTENWKLGSKKSGFDAINYSKIAKTFFFKANPDTAKKWILKAIDILLPEKNKNDILSSVGIKSEI